MTHTEAAKLVNVLRDNWDAPPWSQGRYDLFVEAILPYPYKPAAAAIGQLVRRGSRTYRVLVDDMVSAIERRVADVKRLEQHRADRLLLAGPKDPAVGALLRATIERLECKRAAALAPAEREQGASERNRGGAARKRGGTTRR